MAPALCAAACAGESNLDCTTDAEPSVVVAVVDGKGAAIGDAKVSFSVGGGAWTPAGCRFYATSSSCKQWGAGVEQTGTIDIKAESADGSLHAQQSVVVDANACHVNPKSVTMTLK